MTEKIPQQRRTAEEIAAASRLEYGGDATGLVGTSFPAILRLENYKGASSHRPSFDQPEWHQLHISDIHHIEAAYLYDVFGVSTTASILDIGCGDGSGLLNHAMNFKHTGDLVGVNLSPANYFYGEQRASEWAAEQRRQAAEEGREAVLPNVRFVPGDAMNLPESLKQGKFFVTKMEYLLYHLPDPERAIDEALETLDDNGFFVVSSRGEDNMEVMWKENLPKIADILGAAPPKTFYADYPIDQLKQDMEKRGLVCKASYTQKEPIDITADRLDTYALTHSALYNHFRLHTPANSGNSMARPTPTYKQTKDIVDEIIVKPARQRMEVDPSYTLTDKVHQIFYIYQKPGKNTVPRRSIVLPESVI